MKCSTCGNNNGEDTRFCSKCGARVEFGIIDNDSNRRTPKSTVHIKKSTKVIGSIFAIIIILAILFMSINIFQLQSKLNTPVDHSTKEVSPKVEVKADKVSTDKKVTEPKKLKETVVTKSATAPVTQVNTSSSNLQLDSKSTDQTATNQFFTTHKNQADDFYKNFRSDYETALNSGDFSHVSGYFSENNGVKSNYRDFVSKHIGWDYDYYYTFLMNDTTLEPKNANTIIVTSHETFELYKGGYKQKTSFNERIKRYTVAYKNQLFYITNIESIDSNTSVQNN
ncbi:zinc ribbon domain-containing protein [Kurthia sibirica]|uniref:Zinc-ribbon domain-containing protein n=1 Tax=Kurthia sibirica TaxID=202750 RepID=A0A2U3APJ2_9BACL|nr:zinc ribbon domain-containing protein [Kurthia sibirica]PWI26375.1 hypothetical protein DEX24_03295 [Kurthia sibirica]GEK34190.1 hypothetical protein KSI01_17230 [Kurthia sibirica]